MQHLQIVDPDIYKAIQYEIARQQHVLELIASENIVSEAVLEAMGTPLTNKYSEGYPFKRYYGGNEHIDVCEDLAIKRAKRLFGAEHANVQPHSGSQANIAAYFALMELGDKMLAMSLDQGGHLTHGSKVNFSGKFYNVVSYGVDVESETIDMDEVRKLAKKERPKVIVAGASAYPRKIDFKEFRAIADEVDAYFLVDMAHIAGLVATGLHPDPIPYADVVTTTTHKTLRGPRGAMILCKTEDRLRPGDKKNLAQKIDSAVFPGMQGGPLDHVIAAKAVSFKEALEPDFKSYQKQVVKNAKVLGEALQEHGFRLVSGGTDNHLLLVDLTSKGISGKEAELALDKAGITVNKNMIPYDKRSPFDPSGMRIGTPAVTTRGMKEGEMRMVAAWISKVIDLPKSEDVLKGIRKEVRELCNNFRIYEDLQDI